MRLLRYIRHELLLVLATSSSEAALPPLINKLERAGCARSVAGLVVPAGYSFNLDGTNIYMTLATLFLAQATNTPLSMTDQMVILGVLMLTSKGSAGVTGSGFITLAATLAIVPQIPIAGLSFARTLTDRGLRVQRQVSVPIEYAGMRFDEGFRKGEDSKWSKLFDLGHQVTRIKRSRFSGRTSQCAHRYPDHLHNGAWRYSDVGQGHEVWRG